MKKILALSVFAMISLTACNKSEEDLKKEAENRAQIQQQQQLAAEQIKPVVLNEFKQCVSEQGKQVVFDSRSTSTDTLIVEVQNKCNQAVSTIHQSAYPNAASLLDNNASKEAAKEIVLLAQKYTKV